MPGIEGVIQQLLSEDNISDEDSRLESLRTRLEDLQAKVNIGLDTARYVFNSLPAQEEGDYSSIESAIEQFRQDDLVPRDDPRLSFLRKRLEEMRLKVSINPDTVRYVFERIPSDIQDHVDTDEFMGQYNLPRSILDQARARLNRGFNSATRIKETLKDCIEQDPSKSYVPPEFVVNGLQGQHERSIMQDMLSKHKPDIVIGSEDRYFRRERIEKMMAAARSKHSKNLADACLEYTMRFHFLPRQYRVEAAEQMHTRISEPTELESKGERMLLEIIQSNGRPTGLCTAGEVCERFPGMDKNAVMFGIKPTAILDGQGLYSNEAYTRAEKNAEMIIARRRKVEEILEGLEHMPEGLQEQIVMRFDAKEPTEHEVYITYLNHLEAMGDSPYINSRQIADSLRESHYIPKRVAQEILKGLGPEMIVMDNSFFKRSDMQRICDIVISEAPYDKRINTFFTMHPPLSPARTKALEQFSGIDPDDWLQAAVLIYESLDPDQRDYLTQDEVVGTVSDLAIFTHPEVISSRLAKLRPAYEAAKLYSLDQAIQLYKNLPAPRVSDLIEHIPGDATPEGITRFLYHNIVQQGGLMEHQEFVSALPQWLSVDDKRRLALSMRCADFFVSKNTSLTRDGLLRLYDSIPDGLKDQAVGKLHAGPAIYETPRIEQLEDGKTYHPLDAMLALPFDHLQVLGYAISELDR